MGWVDVNEARRVVALDGWIGAAAEAAESMKSIVELAVAADNHP